VSAQFSLRTSPAFVIGGLGWEPDPRDPRRGWNDIPYGGWVCFHCADRFPPTTAGIDAAGRHFGPGGGLPRCKLGPNLPLEGC